MTKKAKWQEQANKWLEKAERNLSDAKILYREGGFGDTICFLDHWPLIKFPPPR